MALTAGSILENRYRIEHLMGRGGMGAVYRAYDIRLQQTVAIKENTVAGSGLSADALDAARRQFEREALMLARLRHANLPRVIDHLVMPGGDQYLVMDFIAGDDLGQIIARGGPVPEARAIAWIGQVCSALEYLHNQRPPIIHRDIKPQNIKVTHQGQLFLVDFGIAKVGDISSQTAAGALNVTPGFSPPEQYALTGTDVRTDVYALGATLYALLTGQTPPDSISLQSGYKQLIPPREMNASISPGVQQAVLAAMAARRDDRPRSVTEFWRMLSAGSSEQRVDTVAYSSASAVPVLVPGQPVRADSRLPARTTSKPRSLALVGAAFIALIAMVVVNSMGANRAQAPVSPSTQPTLAAASPTATGRPSDTPLPTAFVQPSDTPSLVTAQPTGRPAAISNPPRTPEQVDAIELTGKSVTIVYWHQWSQWNQNLLQAMLDDFNRTNPYGITAQAEPVSTSYSGIYNKVNAAIRAGQPPEMSVAFQSQAALYRSAGEVIDLTPFIQSKKYGLSQAELDDFFPAMLAGDINPYYAGERLGLPIQRAMDVLYYNADWLKQLGYTTPPQDWKQFEEIACKATDKSKKRFGWTFRHDATNLSTFIFARGGRILSEDGKAYVFNGDAGVETVRMIQRMFEKGCAVEVAANDSFGEQTRFARGEALFVFASSVSLPFYADAVNKAGKFKWDIAMPPNSGRPAITLSGPSVSLHKTTPEKELAAWLVVKFLSEKAQTTRWSVETGYLPVRQSARADTLAGLRADRFYGPVADLYSKLFDWLPYSVTEPPVVGYDSVRLLLDREVMSKAAADPNADAQVLLEAGVKKANDTLKP